MPSERRAIAMANFVLCGCGSQVDTADKRPGEVVVCPGCGSSMPIPGDSPEELVRQLLATPDRPGVFALVQLDDVGSPPQRPGSAGRPTKPAGWFQRLLRRLGLG
jgi:hypothetical protein